MNGIHIPEPQSEPSARRPRFSLFTLLLLTSITALSITVGLLWREVKPLRVENKRLHEERGTLMIDDPTKLQAIKIPDRFAGEGRVSYRIFVPKGSLYWAFVVVNDIAKEGYPQVERYPMRYSVLGSGTNLPLHGRLEPGEHVLTIRTVRRSSDQSDIQLIVDGLWTHRHTRRPIAGRRSYRRLTPCSEAECNKKPRPPMRRAGWYYCAAASWPFPMRACMSATQLPNPTSRLTA